ncbi:OmpH family outer membrane protein [Emticicia fluvialis]|uniref:OmpH family outer membrane protein n=1 Tax=Emticicia fluvialis TaxID=2974474 RepID=UPI0021655B33|nr:OmpH family outer membrane protein [Emticicia fluvialis]
MKKTIILLFLALFSIQSFAQKFGYIDSEFITSKMPEYKKAKDEMEKYSEKWVLDVQGKYEELEKMRQQFQREEILLTAEMKRERQKALDDKEKEVKELNNKIFGMNGLLFAKKKEIMKPIMDDIYKACEKVARQKQLMFIFDKASDMSMIYTDPRHDYTDYVMEALGISLKEDKNQNNQVTKPKK